LWDHGGGSIAGFGHDEHFDDELSLLELNYALKKSVSPRRKLEFVGFDACLMATVEVGVVVSDYAKYLVASQDLEPAEGWDYAFLREISARPHINGEALGRLICDYYMKFFSENGDHDHYLTMSVIDVQKLTEVMKSLGTFGAQGKEKISGGGLAAIAETRSKTIAFGGSSYRDANCDMVDIRDICEEFRPYFIECADMLKTSLYGAVVHNVHNAEHDLGGLSVYFVYHGARQAQANLDIYSELYMSADYTNFLFAFADGVRARGGTLRGILSDFFSRSTRSTGETIIDGKTFVCSPVLYKEEHGEMCVVGNIHHQNSEGGVAWLAVEDCPLISTKISGSTNTEVHSVQVRHNDKTGEMLIKIEKSDDAMPNAKILGIRYDCTPMKRKGLFQLKRGDKLELLEPDGNSRTFQFTIEKSIKLEYITSIGYVEGCCVADMYGDKYFCKS
ncbi:MAG: clostripain-related cysteine peptidase, partial [Oscillospiraceae bacterium]|nr:clostripain-related cysteine peptidase [Oscillospiraceae bacterium]